MAENYRLRTIDYQLFSIFLTEFYLRKWAIWVG